MHTLLEVKSKEALTVRPHQATSVALLVNVDAEDNLSPRFRHGVFTAIECSSCRTILTTSFSCMNEESPFREFRFVLRAIKPHNSLCSGKDRGVVSKLIHPTSHQGAPQPAQKKTAEFEETLPANKAPPR